MLCRLRQSMQPDSHKGDGPVENSRSCTTELQLSGALSNGLVDRRF